MKSKILISVSILFLAVINNTAFGHEEEKYGVYVTKEDFMNHRITELGEILESENYNVGILVVKQKDKSVLKINCIKEDYFGFRFTDGHDYINLGKFFARLVITGRINFLISAKADFKIDEKGNYVFTKAPNGNLNFYFVTDLGNKDPQPLEKLIADDKDLTKKYLADKENYGEFINKQLHYLKIYNATVPKQKDIKKGKK